MEPVSQKQRIENLKIEHQATSSREHARTRARIAITACESYRDLDYLMGAGWVSECLPAGSVRTDPVAEFVAQRAERVLMQIWNGRRREDAVRRVAAESVRRVRSECSCSESAAVLLLLMELGAGRIEVDQSKFTQAGAECRRMLNR